MNKNISILLLLASLTLGQSVFAQGNPIQARAQQRMRESQEFLNRGDYNMAANRIAEASSMMRGTPDGTGQGPVDVLKKGINDFEVHMRAQKANKPVYNRILIAQEPMLNSLVMYDPQNPRWYFQRAMVFITRAGGPSASGTAGDRHYFVQAIGDLDKTLSCPGNAEFVGPANQLKASCQKELSHRREVGAEIRRRGARQFARIYGMPGGNSGDSGPSLCTVCGHSHRSGECTYRRD